MNTSNLCNSNLGVLGEVLATIPADPFIRQEICFTQNEYTTRYYSDQPVILDYYTGMSLLVLFQGDSHQVYYLDRIVRLNPNIVFSIVPISENSQVRLFIPEGGILLEKDQITSESVNSAAPSLEFEKLYTFFYQKSLNNLYFRGEKHEPYELVYVDRGEVHILVDGQDMILHQQECMIIGRNNWHMMLSEESVYFLTVSFDVHSSYIDSLSNQVIQIRQDLKVLLEKMVQELDQKLFSNDYIESLMKILLIELIRQPGTQNKSARLASTFYSENDIVNQVLEQISKRIYSKISLQELANSVHISVPYLYVLFQRHLGMPPGKYIMKIRIEESKLLLNEGKLTIGEAGRQMGFSSIQHFSKQFKHICGISPSQYVKGLR